jgi:hypothetical protein
MSLAKAALAARIVDFCRYRLSLEAPPQTVIAIEDYMLGLDARGERPPSEGEGFDWRAIAAASGVDIDVLDRARRLLTPALQVLRREIPPPPARADKIASADVSEIGSPKNGRPRQAARVKAKPVVLTRRQRPPARSEGGAEPFHTTLDSLMTDSGLSATELARIVTKAGAPIHDNTISAWRQGRSAPRTARSLRTLQEIEAHFGLSRDALRQRLPNLTRAIMGHPADGFSSDQRRRLAWHLPDDFGERSAAEKAQILDWIRKNMLSGATDYRRFVVNAARTAYVLRFPGLRGQPGCSAVRTGLRGKKHPRWTAEAKILRAPPALTAEVAELIQFKSSPITRDRFVRQTVWSDSTVALRVNDLGMLFGALTASPTGAVPGLGVPPHRLAMGLLVFPAVWDWFLRWKEARRGFFSGWEASAIGNLGVVLTAPRTGWLTQSPGLLDRVRPIAGLVSREDIADAAIAWRPACQRMNQHARQRVRDILGTARPHRDPFEAILPILEAESPLAEYRKIALEIETRLSDRCYPVARAEGVRALLAIRLGLHLGLRQKNLRQLLFVPRGADPTSDQQLSNLKRGELRWSEPEAGWRVFIPRSAFKNRKSMFFGNNPFSMMLPDYDRLYEHIDAYLAEYRPVLLGSASDPGTFFVKTFTNRTTEAAYSEISFYALWRGITERYGVYNPFTMRGAVPGLLPHGPHSVRDVLATHILKQNGSLEHASFALQTTPEVVARHYVRFLPEGKSAMAAKILNRVWEETD